MVSNLFHHFIKGTLSLSFFLWIHCLYSDPLIDASIDPLSNQAHFPLSGTITITHDAKEIIDSHSFSMEKKPLETSFVKDVKMSAGQGSLISIYSFQIDAKDPGTYLLPPVSVKISGNTYQSLPSSYEVSNEAIAPTIPSKNTAHSTSPLIFRLEASVKGPTTLYLGERTTLVYRISYNRSVDLSKSTLPMVHPDHLQKIGDVQIVDRQLSDMTTQEISQEVEASEIGTFSFGPSSIEGYAYTMQHGEKIYSSDLLKATAPPVTLTVLAVPKEDIPSSYTGALGKITAVSRVQSSKKISVGEPFIMQVVIQGVSNMEALQLPSLACQVGFSGFFQMDSLPPLAKIEGNTKVFDVPLRPLTSLITQIPSIELSSFDATAKKYIIWHTSPIPITIEPQAFHGAPSNNIPFLASFPSTISFEAGAPPPLSIKGISTPHLEILDSSLLFHKWWGVIFVFVGLFLLWLQSRKQKEWEQYAKSHTTKSTELFKQAIESNSLAKLEQAFWLRLQEKKILSQGETRLEKIPEGEKWEEVHAFLLRLQFLQYGGLSTFDKEALKSQAKQQFSALE